MGDKLVMKRGDKSYASNRALYCCSEHFVETDYKRSLTGTRRGLVKNAVPSIFKWSDQNDEWGQRSVRARIRGDKTNQSFASPLDKETESASDTFKAMTASKIIPRKRIWTAKHKTEI